MSYPHLLTILQFALQSMRTGISWHQIHFQQSFLRTYLSKYFPRNIKSFSWIFLEPKLITSSLKLSMPGLLRTFMTLFISSCLNDFDDISRMEILWTESRRYLSKLCKFSSSILLSKMIRNLNFKHNLICWTFVSNQSSAFSFWRNLEQVSAFKALVKSSLLIFGHARHCLLGSSNSSNTWIDKFLLHSLWNYW